MDHLFFKTTETRSVYATALVVNKEVFALFIFLLQQHEQTFNHYQTKFSFERVSLILVSLVVLSLYITLIAFLILWYYKINYNYKCLNF